MEIKTEILETKGNYKKYKAWFEMSGVEYHVIEEVVYWLPDKTRMVIDSSLSNSMNGYPCIFWSDKKDFKLYADINFSDGIIGRGMHHRLMTIA